MKSKFDPVAPALPHRRVSLKLDLSLQLCPQGEILKAASDAVVHQE